jgi:hypothetical protein
MFILPRIESAGVALHVAHHVALVGEAEVFDEAVCPEEDFGGLDFHEGTGVGDHAFPALSATDPELKIPNVPDVCAEAEPMAQATRNQKRERNREFIKLNKGWRIKQ